MKKLFVIICTTLIVGCSNVSKVEVPNIAESESVNFVDLRPANEKENEIFSLFITSDAYALYRRGDDLVEPAPVRLLQHRAYEKLSSEGNNPEVVVYHMVVYLNLQSELRGVSLGGLFGGAVGGAIAGAMEDGTVNSINSLVNKEEFEAMLADEYLRVTYTKDENPNEASVFVTYIDAEINGKRSFVKSMTPTRTPDGIDPHVASVESAISYLLEQYH
ncbi:hypothetical protein [Psychromonas ossibalaenae]|uniref:hypothetical protein n=1 Tax=Psychromonas ossibalaenae TaxID=444922 RepID=UPI00037DA31F|nr:hypothetical protein [Psychromonas ossibalaenae]